MLYKWNVQRRQAHFYTQTKGILDTPPMPVIDAPWSIVSMVSDSYVQMYILAVKSFYARLGRGRIVAIVDRDMRQASRQMLTYHFPGILFMMLEDIDTGTCQRGGTWERLLHLLDRSEREYVIQLDADTLTFGDISEVKDLVEKNVAFTLNGSTSQDGSTRPSDLIRPIEQIAAEARQLKSDYIGIVAERLYDQYPDAQNFKYVRGSSAFVGLAKQGISRSEIEKFHAFGQNLLGKRWLEWGTEQSASNFSVANTPGAVVLPYPKYGNFDPDAIHPNGSFLHFIGSRRYMGGHYASLAANVIKELNRA